MTLKDFYSLFARLFLGYVFFSSGLCKLADGHFGQLIGPPWIIKYLEQYHLDGFAWFLAFSQVLIGALVLSQRWSILGLVMLVPMNATILAVTTSMQWKGTPYVNAFLLAINILALLYEWKTLRFFLIPDTPEVRHPSRTQQLFPYVGLALGTVLAAVLAAVAALFSHTVLMIAGVATLLLSWANVWQSSRVSWLARTALVGSLFAVVSLALTEQLSYLNISVFMPMLAGVGLTALAMATITLRNWTSKTGQLV